jgi:hypothetical protein
VKKNVTAIALAAGLLLTSVAQDASATHGWCQKCKPVHAIDCEQRRCVIVRDRGTDDAAVLHKGTWKQVEYRRLFNDRDCRWEEDGSPSGC